MQIFYFYFFNRWCIFFSQLNEPLLPSVLVPGLDLRVGKVEGGGQFHPVLHAQILLALKAALQLRQLVVGEGRAGFSGLLEPDLGAVSAAGDLPVPLFFHWWPTEHITRKMHQNLKW